MIIHRNEAVFVGIPRQAIQLLEGWRFVVEQLENNTSAWMPHPILYCNFPKILFDIFCLCMVVLWGSFHISKAKVFGNIFGGYININMDVVLRVSSVVIIWLD